MKFGNKQLDSVSHFFMIFVSFFHPSRTDAAALQFLLFPLSADVRQYPKRGTWAETGEFIFLRIPSHYLHRDRVNFRARKAKNSRIRCKIFASFSSVRCIKLLTSAKFSFEAAPRPPLSQCSVWQRKKFACNADSAEIVQIFRAKVRELVANFLRL